MRRGKVTSDQKRFSLKEKSWIMYDWADSVYATNIMAAIFPILFSKVAKEAGAAGDQLLSYGVSAATLVVALLAPVLGAIADFKGMKKKLFTGFWLGGVVFTAMIALTNDYRVMLIGYVLSRIGYSGSSLFYDSFLTDVTTNDRMDKVSAWGYAMGYIGGSTIPFVLSIALLVMTDYSAFAQKFSILITSAWWLVFTIPFLKNVHQEHYIERNSQFSLDGVFRSVANTAAAIVSQKGLMLFMIAYFFYIDGVGTIINISTAYGSTLGLGGTGMILALLVTQIVAMPCSILFGHLARRVTARRALLLAIAVYMLICFVGFIMGFTLEPHQKRYDTAFKAYKADAVAAVKETYAFEDGEALDDELQRYMAEAKTAVLDGDTAGLALDAAAFSGADAALAQDASETLAQATAAFSASSAQAAASYQGAISRSTVLFWAMAVLVGTVQGGIQAVSRSFFGKLIPKERSNEYFGFFDIFGKFASVVGPFLYGTMRGITGRSSYGTLVLLLLFVMGFVVLLRAKKPLEELETSNNPAA